MKYKITPIKGTSDFLPGEMLVREKAREIILNEYRKNGFLQIKTPVLENLDLLLGSEGGDNLKLMFKTIKRGNKLNLDKENLQENDIVEEGLRYDLTVPLVRFYCNNKEKLPTPFKSIQIDDAFRAETPQRGRGRQFTQCDIDIIGDKSINAEKELLIVALNALKNLKFTNLVLKINDRRILNSVILFAGFKEEDINSVCIGLDKIDKIGLDGVMIELTGKEFKKENIDKLIKALDDITKNGPSKLTNYGVPESVVIDVESIIFAVEDNCENVTVKYDIGIVRGQDYYTGTIYEIYTDGFKGAISAGGRYDKMINKMIGLDMPAVGICIGFEPVSMLLKERGVKFNENKKIVMFYEEGDDFSKVLKAKMLLTENYDVVIMLKPKNVKFALLRLKEAGFNYFINFNKLSFNNVESLLEKI